MAEFTNEGGSELGVHRAAVIVRAAWPRDNGAVVMSVSGTEIEAFQADGAVVLRGLLEPAQIELLRAGIEENLAHPSPRAKVASSPDDPGWFIEDFCCWQDNASYRCVIFESALGRAGAALMRSHTASRAARTAVSGFRSIR